MKAFGEHPILRTVYVWLICSAVTVSVQMRAQTKAPDTSPSHNTAPGLQKITAYQKITTGERFQWFVRNTIGPRSLAVGLFSAAYGTGIDSPREYGPHWDGFGKRYGLRLTGISTGNAMEAGLGAMWGEDPRYVREAGHPFKKRVAHIIKMTFLATNRSGATMPAYARYIGITGNNFLSNTWRPDSVANASSAVARSFIGLLGRMAGNAFAEFGPDARKALSRSHDPPGR